MEGKAADTAGLAAMCTVLVTSCDAYMDVASAFAFLWRRWWPDCPFKTVLLTETLPEMPEQGIDRVIKTGKGKSWSRMLVESLNAIDTEYVLMLCNDYLLESRVDTDLVVRRLMQAKEADAANLRLVPRPPGRRPWRDTDLLEFPKSTAYSVSCQTGFWRRDYLMKLASRTESAWEFERKGSYMNADEARPLLVTREQEFPFVDAVHKGYWEPFGMELCLREGVPVDLDKRGAPPFLIRAKEALKRVIFNLSPELVVRVQNMLSRG